MIAVAAAILLAAVAFHLLELNAAARARARAERTATRRRHPTSHVRILDTDPGLEP